MKQNLVLTLLISAAFLGLTVSAVAAEGPSAFSYEGRLTTSAGDPIEGANIVFNVKVLSADGLCTLLDENTALNMASSNGYFALNVGSGTRTGLDPGNTRLAKVFANGALIPSNQVGTPTPCAGYIPAAGAVRKIRITVDDGSSVVTMTPDVVVHSSPNAMVAETLQGKSPEGFLQTIPSVETTPGTTQNRVVSLLNTRWSVLDSLINGTSNLYATSTPPVAPVAYNNQRLTDIADPTALQDAVTKNYSDTRLGSRAIDTALPSDGQSLVWNAGMNKWVAATPVSTDATKLPLAGGTMTGALNLGGQNILNSGHVQMAPQKTFLLGRYTSAEESSLVASLAAGDHGRVWYNTSTNKQRLWNGSAAVDVGSSALNLGNTAGTAMAADSVPSCSSAQKLQMSAGPTYGWSCVAEAGGSQWTTSGANVSFNTGSVGIGTINPASQLHLFHGSNPYIETKYTTPTTTGDGFTIGVSRYANGFGFGDPSNTGYVSNGENAPILFRTSNQNRMVLDSLGNLGVGTMNPGAKMHIASLTANPSIYIEALSGSGAAQMALIPYGALNTSNPKWIVGRPSGNASFQLISYDGASTATHLNMSPTGQLGVGTTLPSAILHLKAGTGGAGTAPFKLSAGPNLTTPEPGAIEFDGTNLYYTNSGASRKTILTSGAATYHADNGTAASPSHSFSSSPGTGIYLQAANSIGLATGGTDRMTISPSGNVGIGTTTPGYKLHVAGTVAPTVDGTYNLGAASSAYLNLYILGSVIQTSDRRAKKEIQDSDLGLDFVNSLRPVSYRFKEEANAKIHYGLIAQETEQAIAKAKLVSGRTNEVDNVIVSHDEKTDRYGVKYTELIAPLIKAMQELYARMTGTEARVALLEAENAALKEAVCELSPNAKVCSPR